MQGTTVQTVENAAEIASAFDFLTYRTYIYNRLMRSHMTAEQWKRHFAVDFGAEAVEGYERRLQQQLSVHFREKLHRAQVALFKADGDHRETIEFLSDLYIHIRLTHDAPREPITEERLRELEASYLEERSCA